MRFKDARTVEQICWNLRLADFPRSRDRSLIDGLANGDPPYSAAEAARNNVTINVSNLSHTRLCHEARQMLYNGFFKPGNFFKATTDMGVVHKRAERSSIVTKEISRAMKRSLPYYECQRSKFALTVMHGIGPSHWDTSQRWRPMALGVSDVLIPSGTLLTFDNLPFFAIYREYTAEQLWKLTHGPRVDPGWDVKAAENAIRWSEEQTQQMSGLGWQDYWDPEKMVERMKENSGLYASDIVQTIACFDFYYHDDSSDEEGWRRRIIFDAYGGYSNGAVGAKNILGNEGQWLYNSGDRVWASRIGEILHFQFADLSATAPFRYHSVRSLGWLLYSICHLQNRLQCKFGEAVFETLMNYMRVKSLDDVERALKIELASHGLIDESVQFLSPDERWQPNYQLAELGLNEYKQIIQDNSSAYTQNQNWSRDRVEKTAFQVQAEVNAMMTLVSAALAQAYKYQTAEYDEIFRRFMVKDSRDADVRDFRARVLKRGVPERLLVAEAWELEPERVMGAGNKTLEMAIARQLMEWKNAYNPEAQTTILRQATLSVTDDAALAQELVPDSDDRVSNAAHDAMLAFGSLMVGGRVSWPPDTNRIEVIETLLGELALKVQTILRTGGMASQIEVLGLQNAVAHVAELVNHVGQDPSQKERAKGYNDALGKISNEVKGFAQRLAEAQRDSQANGDPTAAAKIEAMRMQAQVKAENQKLSHAQRTSERQVSHEFKMRQEEEKHQLDMQREADRIRLEQEAIDLETASAIARDTAAAKAEAQVRREESEAKKREQSKTTPAE